MTNLSRKHKSIQENIRAKQLREQLEVCDIEAEDVERYFEMRDEEWENRDDLEGDP